MDIMISIKLYTLVKVMEDGFLEEFPRSMIAVVFDDGGNMVDILNPQEAMCKYEGFDMSDVVNLNTLEVHTPVDLRTIYELDGNLYMRTYDLDENYDLITQDLPANHLYRVYETLVSF